MQPEEQKIKPTKDELEKLSEIFQFIKKQHPLTEMDLEKNHKEVKEGLKDFMKYRRKIGIDISIK